MRDPVQRCLSAFNMFRNRGYGQKIVSMSEDADAAFIQYVQSDHARIRTEYERTIAALQTGLAPDDYRILLYEEMFDPAELKALQKYLGTVFKVETMQQRVHATKYKTNISIQAQAFCRNSFANTYDEVARDFPQVKTLWQY